MYKVYHIGSDRDFYFSKYPSLKDLFELGYKEELDCYFEYLYKELSLHGYTDEFEVSKIEIIEN